MSMTIGRCAITEDPDAGSLRQRGDEVSFDSMIVGSSVDEMKARVQQLRGLMDNVDETVFPFTWSEDSTFDGFYTDIRVDVSDAPVMYTTGACPFSITMRRVAVNPTFEIVASYVERTNSSSMGAGAARPALAIPYAGNEYGWSGATNRETRTVGDGSASSIWWQQNGNAAPVASSFLRWSASAASFYVGAASVEVSHGGTFYPVHGNAVAGDATWRLSNGLLRISKGSTTGNLKVEAYDGTSAWDSIEYRFGAAGSLFAQALSGFVVLRNTPECCVVRFLSSTAGAGVDTQYVTLTLHRGAYYVECTQHSITGTAYAHMVERATAEAATAVTSGIRATANDAAGNKYLLFSTVATTNDLVQGRIQATASQVVWSFMIGIVINGAATYVYNTETQTRYQYGIPVTASQRVVVR